MDPNASKGLQIATLVCGILSVVNMCSWGVGIAFGIAAMILAKNVAQQVTELTGMAKIGKILGLVGIILGAIGLVVMIILAAVGALGGGSSY